MLWADSRICQFTYLLIRLPGLRAKDVSPLGGKSNGRSYGAFINLIFEIPRADTLGYLKGAPTEL